MRSAGEMILKDRAELAMKSVNVWPVKWLKQGLYHIYICIMCVYCEYHVYLKDLLDRGIITDSLWKRKPDKHLTVSEALQYNLLDWAIPRKSWTEFPHSQLCLFLPVTPVWGCHWRCQLIRNCGESGKHRCLFKADCVCSRHWGGRARG